MSGAFQITRGAVQQLSSYDLNVAMIKAVQDGLTAQTTAAITSFNADKAARFAAFDSDKAAALAGFASASGTALTTFGTDKTSALNAFATDRAAALTTFGNDRAAALASFASDKTAKFTLFDTDKAAALSAFATDRATALTNFSTASGTALTNFATASGTAITQVNSARDTANASAANADTKAAAAATVTAAMVALIGKDFTYTLVDGADIVTDVDDELRPLLSYDPATGKLKANGIAGGGSSAVATVRSFFPDMTKPHLVMVVGQSWGTPGSSSGAAISTTTGSYPGALMPPGGVFDASGFVPSDWPDLTTGFAGFVPLREGTGTSTDPDDGTTSNVTGESIVSGFVRKAFSYAAEVLGQRVDAWRVVGCTMANGGKPLAFFVPGSTWYETQIKPALARFAALAPDCGGITFPLVVGGADAVADGTSKADFKAMLHALIDGLQDYCDALWGRPIPIFFPMYPPTRNTMTISDIVQAHLEVAREDRRAVVAMAPYYNGYREDDRHWQNWAAKRFGITGGRAAAQWYAGLLPKAMMLQNATRRVGTSTIRLWFDPLTAPVQLNTADMAAAADYGITLWNGSTVVPIASVAVSGSDVLVSVASPATVVTRVTYATFKAAPNIGYGGAAVDNGHRGTGNLSDSTVDSATIAGTARTLPNFAVQFDEPVLEISE